MGLGAINFDKINIPDIFGGIGTLLKDIREAITGKTILDPSKEAEIQEKLIEAENQLMIGQASINLEEAKSKSIFVSGWRPFIGWICGSGLLVQYLVFPIWSWIKPTEKLPSIDVSSLYPLLFALLGFGTLRTIDKIKGVSHS
jgi:hypothetical protein